MANPTVTIEIKEIGSKHVIGRLAAVQTAANNLANAKKRLSRRTKKTGETFKKSGKDISRFSGLMQNLETNAVLALGPLSGLGARIRAIGVLARRGNVGLIAFSLGIAAVAGIALLLGTALIKARKALEPIEGRLRAVTGSALLARLELERLRQLALDLGLSVDSLSDGFSRLAAAARGTSLEGEGIRRVFDGVAKAAAALRLSTEDTEGILRAFEQALTKGVLRAEEFNQQLGDRLPGAAVLAARAINKTKQEFQAMLVAGEIITEEFLPKLIEQFEELFSAEAERNVETLNGALNRLGTSFSIFFDVLESRIGVAKFVTEVLNAMADNIVRVTGVIDSNSAKASRALALFGKDILTFGFEGVLQTEKDRILKTFTDLRNELQKEFNGIQDEFLRLGDAFRLGVGSLTNISDKFTELGAKKKEIDALTAAIIKLNEFAIKPLSETTPPDITKITKAFDKIVRAAVTASKKTQQIVAGSLFGAEFESSLLKAQNRLAKFSKNVVVAFADANKLISKSLSDAFKEGSEVDKALAFAEVLEIVSDKFATVIQDAKDFKAIGKIFEDTRRPLEKFNIEMRELVRLQNKFGESEAITRAMGKLKEDLAESDEIIGVLIDSFDDLGSTIVEAISKGEGAFQIFSDFLTNLLEQLLEVVIQLTIINPLLNDLLGGERKEGLGGFLGTVGALLGGEEEEGDKIPPIPKRKPGVGEVTQQEDGGGFLESIASALGFGGGGVKDKGTAAGFEITEEFQKMAEAANSATAAITSSTAATDIATAAAKAGSEVLSGDLVDSVTEAAIGTATETVASQTLVGALAELTTSAFAAAAALSAVATSGGGEAGGGILGFLGDAFSGAGGAAASGGRAASAGTSIPGGIGGFAHGGAFTVGGTGGIDDTLVKFRATRREEVKVTPAGGSNERMVVINFNFPPGTNVKEFGEAQGQIGAMLAGTLAVASASNN